MDAIAYILAYITPYIALLVFVGGMAYQVYRWRQRTPITVHLSLFPRPASRLGRVVDALVDTFTMKGIWRVNKPLWVGGFVMHLGLLLLLLGHIRVVTDYYFLWNLLRWGDEQTHLFSVVAGLSAGALFILPLFYLLARRWSGAVKWLSTPEDFFLLALLLTIAITGTHMRLVREVDQQAMREFMQGLFSFHWQPVPESSGASFLWHFAFAQLLLIYFPFSKLMHTIGAIFSKMAARS